MRTYLVALVLAACGAPKNEPPDATPRDTTSTPQSDAANCVLGGEVTGSLGSYTFGAIANARYLPLIVMEDGGRPQEFEVSDATGGLDLHFIGYPGSNLPMWTLSSGGHGTYPPYLPGNEPITATVNAGCWTVTFHTTFNQCDGNGGNCTTPVGSFDGTVHVGM
jgi:hypothetical protein